MSSLPFCIMIRIVLTVGKIFVSGSGLMKIEVFYGATGAEVVKAVKFN